MRILKRDLSFKDVVSQVLGTRIPVARAADQELSSLREWSASRPQ